MSRVAVLGGGPGGLVAAHCAELYGNEVKIFGIQELAWVYGASWLREPINELTSMSPEFHITISKLGRRDGYIGKFRESAQEQAAAGWDRFEYGENVPGWNLLKHYTALFQRFGRQWSDAAVHAPEIEEILGEWDLVINTLNPKGHCLKPEEHTFTSTEIRATMATFANDQPGNTIIFSGMDDDKWYRSSSIDGAFSTEYAIGAPYGDKRGTPQRRVMRPLSKTCDCFLDRANFFPAGPYGLFRFDVKIHDIFDAVAERLDVL